MQQNYNIPQTEPSNSPEAQAPKSPQYSAQNNGKKPHWIREFLANFGILIAAPLIAIFLITFVFQSYEVDGPSMERTLQDGDRLVVLKVGKSWADLTNKDYIPARGDVVIFHKTDSLEFGGSDRQLVKRVIGLPGERVRVSGGKVTVYNQESPNGFNPDSNTDYSDDIDSQTPGNIDLTIGEGEVFVLGDNRNNSSDSRAFGTVSAEQIVGKLSLRIFPFSGFRSF